MADGGADGRMFALVDGNNFYVSCERAFDPKLRDRPVCVLSNGDGCVVVKAPHQKEIDEYVYKIDASCYKYTPNLVPCRMRNSE